MIPLAPAPEGKGPLAQDAELWSRALRATEAALEDAARGRTDLALPALAVACGAARAGDPAAPLLLALVRRIVVRSDVGSERALRCLRALARAGQPVDVDRLAESLGESGRLPRIALAALAELAAREDSAALELVMDALTGALRAEAAQLLAAICSEPALDALSRYLRSPGPTGIHAAGALLSAEDDPFAFEVLTERLCESSDAVLAAKVLWGARAEGAALMAAESALARWAHRGVESAEQGRLLAAALLTAGGRAQDVTATWRALASEDDELALVGAQGAYALGDAERARAAAIGLVRRGPVLAAQAFALLVRWADYGDSRALALVRSMPEQRPVELARASVLEALAGATRPALHAPVEKALHGHDRAAALEAARALTRLREPPAMVPATWL